MKLECDFDQGSGGRARLGVIVLAADETLESEFRGLFDIKDVALYHARIASDALVTPQTLKQMQGRITQSAALLPASRALDVIGYACTSAATVIGEQRVCDLVRKAHPGVGVTNPVTAAMAAMRALGAMRIGLVTPYVADVSTAMISLLEKSGFRVAGFGSFEQVEDAAVARITDKSLLRAICEIGAGDEVEAVFASCTNLRSFGIVEQAEKILGKPVITSNLALGWHMAQLAELASVVRGPGRLFAL